MERTINQSLTFVLKIIEMDAEVMNKITFEHKEDKLKTHFAKLLTRLS